MGMNQVPEFESSASSQDDNPFAGKISVKLPSENCFFRKLRRLNLTLTEGYPTSSADTMD